MKRLLAAVLIAGFVGGAVNFLTGSRFWPTAEAAHSAKSNTSGTVGWLFF